MDIKITKALVDSDLDGVVCAAMLKNIYGDIKVRLTDPSSLQAGRDNDFVDENTVIADLSFVDGCGLYFDHHSSNEPKGVLMKGMWEKRNSAAEVIYSYYRDEYDLSRYTELIKHLGRFDSGLTTLFELERMDDYLLLAFSIERLNKEFSMKLINILAEKEWEEVLKDKDVKTKMEGTRKNILLYKEFIKSNTQIIDNIAFVDNRGFGGSMIHAFFVAEKYPEVDVIIMAKKAGDDIRLTMFWNNFNQDGVKYDLVSIAKEMNPEASGGHKGACGFTLKKGMDIDEALDQIIKKIA